jgi:thiosulfate/3-mercaptopyruvate sulfurtransferase
MPSPLIAPEALAAALDAGTPPTLLDVRWKLGAPPGIDGYRRAHLPGACFVDLETELAGPPGVRGRHPLVEEAVFEAAMRRCGVRMDHPVVVYDADDSSSAARLWWMLTYYGHPDTRVLDGGLHAWSAAGLPTTAEVPTPAPGDFTATAGGRPMLDAQAAADLARRGVLLDARTGERFRGEMEPIDRVAGHIPGARSAPTLDNLDPTTMRFQPPDALRRRFAALGATGHAEVGAYCGSGVTAAHEILALEVAGIDAALYVGSWSEWISDPGRPVATGPEE